MAGIYVHVPFCRQRCTYCDFYFVTTAGSHAPFLAALTEEISAYGLSHGGREPISTVYIGGGTPSRLDLADINAMLASIEGAFDASALEEVTIEVNPDDIDGAYLRGLKALGVTRLSIGVQSFFAPDLEFMNRSHTSEQATEALGAARAASFDSYSVDLIFAVPGQPEEYWAANLERLVKLEVPHISTYSLTVEAATPLARMVRDGDVTPVDDGNTADQYSFAMRYLADSGYEHYEISSFALPGHRAKHNSAYWSHNNYLGFGPSAHSFWFDGTGYTRWANVRNLNRYVGLLQNRTLPVEFREDLDAETVVNERIMLRLRTTDGFNVSSIAEEFGIDLYEERVDDLAWLESEALIHPIRNDVVRLTDAGKAVCDMVTTKLML